VGEREYTASSRAMQHPRRNKCRDVGSQPRWPSRFVFLAEIDLPADAALLIAVTA
jgi:hypothetical protein